jgi:AcrR family transcriptional regulator
MSFCSNNFAEEASPKQERSRQTYERILVAAEGLFAEKGWDSLSTNAIAEAAEVSIGSLYRYFPDKAAVLRALVSRAAEPLLARMDSLLAEGGEPLDAGLVMERMLAPGTGEASRGSLCLNRLQGSRCSDELAEISAEVEAAVEAKLALLVARLVPGIEPEAARVKAKLVRGIVSAASAAADREPKLAPALAAELKSLVAGYLAAPVAASGRLSSRGGRSARRA